MKAKAPRFARRLLLPVVVTFVAFLLAACKGSGEGSGGEKANATTGDVSLNGAGATFPYPLYSKWMSEYNKQNPNVKINYQSIGSGGGIRQILAGTVDFGASDAPMSDDEMKKAPHALHHIPATLGGVAIAYNLEGVKDLKLSSEALAGIYLGTITKWNDAKIAETNDGVTLPDQDITVAYRSDGSGTTAVFSDYLAKVSSEWKDKVGVGKSLKWPRGLGAKGNEGVTGQVKTTKGAIGYVELAYAITSKLEVAALKNKSGEFLKPSIDAITAAAAGEALPDSLTTSITDSPGKGAYPISSYSYLLVYEDTKDATKGEALAKFIWWAIHDGQKMAGDLHYAPLPDAVVKQVEALLKKLKAGDKTLLP